MIKTLLFAVMISVPFAIRGQEQHFSPPVTFYGASWKGYFGNAFADVTGDGMADAIKMDANTIYVERSTGSSFWTPTPQTIDWSSGAFYGGIGPACHFADVDGDGKADAIVLRQNQQQVVVRRSTGSYFGPAEVWATKGVLNSGTFADVTGDGKADFIASNALGTYVGVSTGSSFLDHVKWTTSYSWDHIADVDGDRKMDFIIHGVNDSWQINRSTGNGLTFDGEWWDGEGAYNQPFKFGDFTGDGKADGLAYRSYSNNEIIGWRSNCSSFLEPAECGSFALAFTHVADVNGDGKADLVKVGETNINVSLSKYKNAITGVSNVECSSSSTVHTFTVRDVIDGMVYTWSGAGGGISSQPVSGQGTKSATFRFNPSMSSSTITVTAARSTCRLNVRSFNLTKDVSRTAASSTIGGNDCVQVNGTGMFNQLTILGSNHTWSVSSGFGIVGSNTGTSVTVAAYAPINGSVILRYNHPCDNSLVTITKNIYGAGDCYMAQQVDATEESRTETAYPNPASTILTIQNAENVSEVRIVDQFGDNVHQSAVTSTEHEHNIDLTTLKDGSYILVIRNKDGYLRRRRLIVSR
jgi:hypothetical protein